MQVHPPTGQVGIGSGNEWCPQLENRREKTLESTLTPAGHAAPNPNMHSVLKIAVDPWPFSVQ